MTEPPPRTPQTPPPLAEELPDDLPTRFSNRPSSQQARAGVPLQAPAVNSAEVEKLLRQANLLRVRGDLPGAVRELRKALDMNPAAGGVHEMLGDILAQAGDSVKALESYVAAQSNGAGPAIEAKIARILVKRDDRRRSISDETLIRGGGPVAIVASALVPGMGLILAGETRPALISIIGWLVTLSLLVAVPSIRAVLPAPLGDGRAGESPGAMFLALVLGLANLAFYVYSLIETVRVAKPAGKDGQDD